ncbi:hypothetical protein [Vibrio metschnikovii]|nr:hypothetical protein [Vibrio metschnikovii]
MYEPEHIAKLEKEIAELKSTLANIDDRIRAIAQEEFQKQIDLAMSHLQ